MIHWETGDGKWKRQWIDSKQCGCWLQGVLEWRQILKMFNKILEVFPKATGMQACPRQAYGAWALPIEVQPWDTLTSDTSASTRPFRRGTRETILENQIFKSSKNDKLWYPEPAAFGPVPQEVLSTPTTRSHKLHSALAPASGQAKMSKMTLNHGYQGYQKAHLPLYVYPKSFIKKNSKT